MTGGDMQSRSAIPLSLLIVILVTFAALIASSSQPFSGLNARIWVAGSVRNYDLYPFNEVGLLPTRNTAPVSNPDDFIFYTHHPPLITWMPAAVTEFVGFHEFGVRIGFIWVTVIGIAAMYVLSRRLLGRKMALWATMVFALTPFTLYFGAVPGHDNLGMAAFLLYAAVFVNWMRQPSRSRLALLVTLAVFAVWTAWPAVVMMACFSLVGFLIGDIRQRVVIVGLGVVSVVAFAVMMGLYQLHWNGAVESLLDAYLFRSSNASLRRDSESFTMIEFFARLLLHVVFLGTAGVLVLAAIGGLPLWKRSDRHVRYWVIGLFAGGLLYQLIFRNASYIHDYYKFFLMPSLAMMAAFAVIHVRAKARSRYTRPFIDALVLTAAFTSFFVTFVLIRGDDLPWVQDITAIVSERKTDDDIIMSNLRDPAQGPVLEYYLFHTIEWSASPGHVIERASSSDNAVWYIYCTNRPYIESQPAYPDIAQQLADYEAIETGYSDCTIYALPPGE